MSAQQLLALVRADSPIDLRSVTIVGGVDLRSVGTLSSSFRCTGCTFDGPLIATDVVFVRLVDLSGATLRGNVDLKGAIFDDAVLLKRATIGTTGSPATVDARLARFSGPVNLDQASFSGDAIFTGSRFLATASFAGAEFEKKAQFDLATFSEGAFFTGGMMTGDAPTSGPCSGMTGAFRGIASFRRTKFAGGADFGSRCFGGPVHAASAFFGGPADFTLATFEREANFTEATFADRASFRLAGFQREALFSNVTSGGDVVFDAAHFGAGAVLFQMATTGRLSLVGVDLREGETITLNDVIVGSLLMRVELADDILGSEVRERTLRILERSAQSDGNIPMANDARFKLLALQHDGRDGIPRYYDSAYRTIGGYLVRPWYPLRAFLALLFFSTLARSLAALWAWWSPRRKPKVAAEEGREQGQHADVAVRQEEVAGHEAKVAVLQAERVDPPAGSPSPVARAHGRFTGLQRVITTIFRKAGDSLGIALSIKDPKKRPSEVEDTERIWPHFYTGIRWAEFIAYKLLTALFLLALANSNATARQVVDSIRG
jgi:uncharacterized protein YjbI with pentapeptide repeats